MNFLPWMLGAWCIGIATGTLRREGAEMSEVTMTREQLCHVFLVAAWFGGIVIGVLLAWSIFSGRGKARGRNF